MKKIAIFATDLGIGGIQRSLSNLLRNIDLDKYSVDLYLFPKNSKKSAYKIPGQIKVKNMKPQHQITKILPFPIYFFFKSIKNSEKYDVAIDFGWASGITATYAIKTRANKHIYWVHNDYLVRHKLAKFPINIKMYLQRSKSKFRKFDEIVGVSRGVLEYFRKNLPDSKLVEIPNFIDTKYIFSESGEEINFYVDRNKFNLVCLGRLEYVKGMDLLLMQLPEVIEKRKDFHLYIIGDGSERENLESICQRLELTEYISFLGSKTNPYPYLKQMDGLVLNSRHEGQGMVLWEGKALGLQLFFPKHLEKYNEGLVGRDDLVKELIRAKKQAKRVDKLVDYNQNIIAKVDDLFS